MTKQITESLRLLNEKIDSHGDILEAKRKDMHELRDNQQTLSLELSLLKERLKETANVTQETANVTQKISEDTSGLIDLFNDLKGGIKMLGYLGKILSWMSGITLSIYGIWEMVKK